MFIDRQHPSTARISINVAEFHEIGKGSGCTRAEIELIDTGNGKVSQAGINAPIVVSAEVYLEFFVHAREGDRYTYIPVGIGFRSEVGVGRESAMIHSPQSDCRDPLGNAAFPVRQIVASGDTAQLTLRDANPEPGDFEFSMIIQRSDGLLGIVDPKIRNSGPLK